MNVSRLVSLAAAIAITATEWAAFSSSLPHTQPARALAAPIAGDASDPALPLIIILADREI
jgi:hypothetical protein